MINQFLKPFFALLLFVFEGFYNGLHKVCMPIFRLWPREIAGYTVFTANIVTYWRTLLVVPIAYCMRFEHNGWACGLVLFHDWLDHVDGIVAKVQREQGYNDDPKWGAFVDAFCDKIVFIFSLWTILVRLGYETEPMLFSVSIVCVASMLIVYEFSIAVVRVNDYFYEYYTEKFANKNDDKQSRINKKLRAVMEGKLKQKFESLGVAFLALSLPTPSMHVWGGYVGVICLAMATYLAHQSLAHKLSAYPQFRAIFGDVRPPE